jgi:hypothetical protein
MARVGVTGLTCYFEIAKARRGLLVSPQVKREDVITGAQTAARPEALGIKPPAKAEHHEVAVMKSTAA